MKIRTYFSKRFREKIKELEIMGSVPVLKVENLCKSYGRKSILKNISFEVERGDVFGFLGPNGSGKTTTIRSVLGLIRKNSGKVSVLGSDMDNEFLKGIKNVGAVVETPKFHDHLSGKANLKLIANLHSELGDADVERVLKLVGMWDRSKHKVKTYSLGMRQRLGIAMALINRPKLVILDEPTNGLDPQGIKEVRELIVRLAEKEGITFFISTHLLAEVEQICNRVVIIEAGKTVVEGRVNELLDKDYDRAEISCEPAERAKTIIESLDYVDLDADSTGDLIVKVQKGRQRDLNKELFSAGIDIDYVVPCNQSLEDYFIEVTKGGIANV
ncbi:MAG: ABC transporter ATP-binding protein [Tissierellales bacterium]|jgi:ABC-2 type transport system ATP-binding protein|nr:ABC transporter ATP-binding protein [Tissierellales bacterium]